MSDMTPWYICRLWALAGALLFAVVAYNWTFIAYNWDMRGTWDAVFNADTVVYLRTLGAELEVGVGLFSQGRYMVYWLARILFTILFEGFELYRATIFLVVVMAVGTLPFILTFAAFGLLVNIAM
jgi:hypothetical protein